MGWRTPTWSLSGSLKFPCRWSASLWTTCRTWGGRMSCWLAREGTLEPGLKLPRCSASKGTLSQQRSTGGRTNQITAQSFCGVGRPQKGPAEWTEPSLAWALGWPNRSPAWRWSRQILDWAARCYSRKLVWNLIATKDLAISGRKALAA